MISQIKRLSAPPTIRINYPVYIRTSNNRFFIKIKSATEAVWLETVNSEKFKIRATGSDVCGEGEFFDVKFMIEISFLSSDKEYREKLKELIVHYEAVKASLNL